MWNALAPGLPVALALLGAPWLQPAPELRVPEVTSARTLAAGACSADCACPAPAPVVCVCAAEVAAGLVHQSTAAWWRGICGVLLAGYTVLVQLALAGLRYAPLPTPPPGLTLEPLDGPERPRRARLLGSSSSVA
jgi:hypothetical protein